MNTFQSTQQTIKRSKLLPCNGLAVVVWIIIICVVPMRFHTSVLFASLSFASSAVTDEVVEGQQRNENLDAAKASGDRIAGELPEGEVGVGVDEKTGVQLPLDLTYTDDEGKFRRLGDFFDGKRPVMLSLNYSDCPMLCSVQWENMVNTLKDISFQPGRDFEIVSLSIDPKESVSRARDTKERYLEWYNLPETEGGWHFLIGTSPNINRLADAIGFRYRKMPNGHYSHPPLYVLCSPEGRVVRYVHGLKVEPKLLDNALIESAEGKIGSPINQFVFACLQYNTVTGQYTTSSLFLMKLGGAATVILLVSMMVPYWFVSKFNKPKEELRDSDLIELT